MNAPFRPPAATAAPRYAVEVLEEIDALAREWRALEAELDSATIFQGFDLMRLWYAAALKSGRGTAAIALVRRTDTGKPVGIFPMLRERRGLLTRLTLADGGVLDYCQPLLAAEIDAGSIDAVIAAVARAMPGDVLYINKVPEWIGKRLNPLVALPQKAKLMLSTWAVPLANDAYRRVVQAERQSSQYKSALRRKIRKLNREHTATNRLQIGAEMGAAEYRLLRDMRARWFVSEGRADGLAHPDWEDFYRRLALGEGGSAQPWLSRIEADGAVIAVLFGLIDDNGAVALMPASQRDEWSKFAPGTQLFEATIEEFARRGVSVLDLSIGDNPYKLYIGAISMPLYDLLIPKTILGQLSYMFWRIKVKLRNSQFVQRLRAKSKVNQG